MGLCVRVLRVLSFRRSLIVAPLVVLCAIGATAGAGDAACPPARAPYATLRYEEDWSFLRDAACKTDPWDGFKYVPLGREGDVFLSTGVDARVKYEYFRNFLWGQGPQEGDGYVLQRYLIHGDLHVTPYTRAFVQLESALEEGRKGGPRATDEDKLDLNQAFLDGVAPLGDARWLTLRVGRQELSYGSQRLVSVREAPNVRQTFDALRLIFTMPGWRIDGFVSRPVEVHTGVFDDHPNGDRSFWGVFAVTGLPMLPDGHTDLYYLGLANDQARFDQGLASEVRHTVGTRLWGRPGEWDYNVELIYQWGTFGRGDIRAWGAASDTGYTLRTFPWRPRLAFRADINSGDRDPGDRNLETFNALFPRGSYFGEIAILGPANLFDVHPYIELHPVKPLTIIVDADSFRRQSDRDGIYSPAGSLVRSGRRSRATHVGEQVGIQAEWQVDRHFSVAANYTHFFAGRFIRETGPGEDIDYTTAWLQYRF
jgi:hypothetical protein